MKIRAFIAVNLSVVSTRQIAEVGDSLKKQLSGQDLRVVWVPPTNIHITLKFLGYTNEEAVEAIAVRLRKELAARTPFDITARGVGAFPDASHPRVIWVGIQDPTGGLAKLAADCDVWMSDLGFKKEERAFRAHVTIGRVKEGKAHLNDVFAQIGDKDCGTSSIREVVVYESKMRSQGSEYLARARIPFKEAQDGK